MNTTPQNLFESILPSGIVVLFEQDGDPLIGLVQSNKKDKYQILNEKGRIQELPHNRLFAFEIKFKGAATQSEQIQFLTSLKSQSASLAEKINLEEIWQLVSEFPKSYSSDELAGLAFPHPSAEQKLAFRLLLISDRAFFKRDKEKFLARPEHIVAELKKAQMVQLERKRLKQGLAEYFKDPSKTNSEDLQPLLNLLKKFAVSAEMSAAEEREAKEICELAGQGLNKENFRVVPRVAYTILEKLGQFNKRTNPAWERAGLSGNIEFRPSDIEPFNMPNRDLVRLDLTHLDVFTIDDISTKDMDDALSLESTEGGYRLGVHISDVASEIPIGTKLDSLIASRLSSIYLPEQTIHMLPRELSMQSLSLLQAAKRRALSLMIDLDREYKVLSTKLLPSWVVVKRRWTYDQVDDLLENVQSEFNTFYEIASAFEAERIEKGAMHVQKTEIIAMVDEDGKVSLKEIEEQSPARALVSEMAVLMNRVVAEYCRDHKIPAIFRGQPRSENDGEPIPDQGRARDHFIRVRLKRSEAALHAQEHAGLGLSAYLQVTSPIRRYVDLINQRQLMAHLAAQPLPYSYDQLLDSLEKIDQGLGKIQKLSKESKRFWLLRYLEQRIAKSEAGRKITGVVVKVGGKHPMVELDEVFFAAFVKTNKKLVVGDKVDLLIGGIEAKEDYLRLETI